MALRVSFQEIRSYANEFEQSGLLGEGGQGAVWRGSMDGRDVAIKRLPVDELMGDSGFRLELAALREVRHENVIELLAYNESGDPNGCSYLVMPLMAGDLAGRMAAMNCVARLRAVLCAFRGLQALHEKRILQ